MLSNDDITTAWPARLAAQENLVWRARHLSTTFLFGIGERRYLVTLQTGRMQVRDAAQLVMPLWDFALQADEAVWREFFKPLPPPEYHDLLAMMKFHRLAIEGNIHAFISHLLFFKALFALLRPQEN